MARTKIVATIGPASNDPSTIEALLRAGMDVARVNFSHGSHEAHTKTVHMLRKVAKEESFNLAILGDLQGPKIRLGNIGTNGIKLAMGDEIIFTPHRGQPAMIHLPHPKLIAALEVGGQIVIGDGEVELVVTEKSVDIAVCRVTVPGLMESNKGVNAPGAKLSVSSMTSKDRKDLKLMCQLKLDYVALSFVRNGSDIEELRTLMHENGYVMPIIAKIEKREAIDNLLEIREATDGMMVARGDLGIEVGPESVPMFQKKIIRACVEAGKPVITATQMLQSMTRHPHPTRAEASDVANAILDGTDAVMLSGETAMGQYPIQAVQTMDKISVITEAEFPHEIWVRELTRREQNNEVPVLSRITRGISEASYRIAEFIGAKAIVTTTFSGYTARYIARHRPKMPIIAITPTPEAVPQLNLIWGTTAYLVSKFETHEEMMQEVMRVVKIAGLNLGDRIVVTSGIFGNSGQTNSIQVYEVE